MAADAAAARIDRLINGLLIKIGTDLSGWETLYRDPQDGRYWELTFPQSEMQGGGPPRLRHISDKEATQKYLSG